MQNRLNQFFDISAYDTLIDQNRVRMVYGITIIMFVLYTLYVIFVPTAIGDKQTYLQMIGSDWSVQLYLIGFYGAAAVTIFYARVGNLDRAAWGPAVMWFFGAHINIIQTGFTNASAGATLFSLILLAGLLQGNKGLVVGLLASLIALLLGIAQRSGLSTEMLPSYISSTEALAENNVVDYFTLALLTLGSSGLVALFLRYANVQRTEGALKAVEDREVTAEILTHIARQVSQRTSLRNLLSEVVEQINKSFGFIYHTQVFLVDDREGREARLVASTGAVGRRLLEMQHSLEVGSTSVIGQVTLHNNRVVARSDTDASPHRRNELLPDTIVEAGFPLRIGNKVLGALDVQSKDPTAFIDENMLATFQALADSTSLAIDNVSQFQQAEARLLENQRLITETQEALHEVERLNERLTGRAWSEYLRGTQDEFALAADVEQATTTPDSKWTEALKEALYDNHLIQKQEDGQQLIAMPLRIRGRVVGAMEFELEETRPFTPEDFDLVQEVSARFGMAIESARLMDESRRIAQREALVNQISSRLQSSNNVENMLNEAARSLRDVLRANKVAIRLGQPPTSESFLGENK